MNTVSAKSAGPMKFVTRCKFKTTEVFSLHFHEVSKPTFYVQVNGFVLDVDVVVKHDFSASAAAAAAASPYTRACSRDHR